MASYRMKRILLVEFGVAGKKVITAIIWKGYQNTSPFLTSTSVQGQIFITYFNQNSKTAYPNSLCAEARVRIWQYSIKPDITDIWGEKQRRFH